MSRRNKMGLAEALAIFKFSSNEVITADLISSKFRKLCFAAHTDKNKNISDKKSGELIAKYTEAKKVLLENIDAIKNKTTADNKPTADTRFVDYIKEVNLRNPSTIFNVYRKGKSKSK